MPPGNNFSELVFAFFFFPQANPKKKMAVGTIVYSAAEGYFISLLITLCATALSYVPLVMVFQCHQRAKEWTKFFVDLTPGLVDFAGIGFAAVLIGFTVVSSFSYWTLRGDTGFGATQWASILYYVSLGLIAFWSWPVLFYVRILPSVLIILAGIAYIGYAIAAWITGPWYSGLLAVIAAAIWVAVFLSWAIPADVPSAAKVVRSARGLQQGFSTHVIGLDTYHHHHHTDARA